LSSDPSGNTVWLPWIGNALTQDGDVEARMSATAAVRPIRRDGECRAARGNFASVTV
jgi:hypothetical protein